MDPLQLYCKTSNYCTHWKWFRQQPWMCDSEILEDNMQKMFRCTLVFYFYSEHNGILQTFYIIFCSCFSYTSNWLAVMQHLPRLRDFYSTSGISSGTGACTVSSWGRRVLSSIAPNLLKDLRDTGKISLHSPSLTSFRPSLSNQSHQHPKISVWSNAALTVAR